jgi:hypothetical protein
MVMAKVEMDILSFATAGWMSCVGTKDQCLLQPSQKTLLEITYAPHLSLKKKRQLSITFLMARAETSTSSAIMASKITINPSTGLTSAVWEELKSTLLGWTLTNCQGETLLARTAVTIWIGLRLSKWMLPGFKAPLKKNKLIGFLLLEWVQEAEVLAQVKFIALICTKPCSNLWPKVVKLMAYKLPNTLEPPSKALPLEYFRVSSKKMLAVSWLRSLKQ